MKRLWILLLVLIGGGAYAQTCPLNAVVGDNSVTLNWTTPTTQVNPDGSITPLPAGTALTYNIYAGTAPGTETLYKSGVSGNTLTITGLSYSTTYYYVITAVDSAGEGPRTNEVCKMAGAQPLAPPSAPVLSIK